MVVPLTFSKPNLRSINRVFVEVLVIGNPQSGNELTAPSRLGSVFNTGTLLHGGAEVAATDPDTKTFVGLAMESETSAVGVQVGQKIGKYEIRAPLGTGGMGSV